MRGTRSTHRLQIRCMHHCVRIHATMRAQKHGTKETNLNASEVERLFHHCRIVCMLIHGQSWILASMQVSSACIKINWVHSNTQGKHAKQNAGTDGRRYTCKYLSSAGPRKCWPSFFKTIASRIFPHSRQSGSLAVRSFISLCPHPPIQVVLEDAAAAAAILPPFASKWSIPRPLLVPA